MGREKKLAEVLFTQIKEKCKLFEKLSSIQKEYEGHEVESSLKDASFEKEATEAQSLEATCAKLNRSNAEFGEEILCLVKELKEEKFTLGGRGGWITRPRDRDHTGQHDETPSLLKLQKKLAGCGGMHL